MKICVVKQHTTYDLFTKTGPTLRALVESSNWRTGPIGLTEVFDCDFRIVWENCDKECQIGKKQWSKYVVGREIWPKDSIAEDTAEVDWGAYDCVIAIDVAVPTRIIRKFPKTLWCYYFIEGGPTAIDGWLSGSPYFGYNVYITQRMAKERLTLNSHTVVSISKDRRAVLDMPYYILSDKTISLLYPDLVAQERSGFVLSHHSYPCLTENQHSELLKFGKIHFPIQKISDIHRCELSSKYYLVHPDCMPMAGVGVIEAISAGCLVLAPVKKLWGFQDLLSDSTNFDNFSQLTELLKLLDGNNALYETERLKQCTKVEAWCFSNPTYNLEYLWHAFQNSSYSYARQAWSECQSHTHALMKRGRRYLVKKARELMGAP